jgi:hypothetical protein
MGGNSSKTSAQQTQEFFNQTTNSFMDSHSQTVNASASGVNTINLQGADLSGCRTYLSQDIDTSVTATGQLSTQSISEMNTQLQNAASQKIDQMAQQKSGFLAPSIMNSAQATSDLKTKVTNIINNTMQSSTVQNILAAANNLNVANNQGLKATCDPAYKLPGPCGRTGQDGCDFVIDQKLKQTVVAKGISDAITKALFSDSVVNSAVQAATQTATQQTQGVNDLVDSIFKGLTGIYGIIALICCCVCIAVLIFLLSPAGQQATTTAANAGAAYAAAH